MISILLITLNKMYKIDLKFKGLHVIIYKNIGKSCYPNFMI